MDYDSESWLGKRDISELWKENVEIVRKIGAGGRETTKELKSHVQNTFFR